MDCQEFLLRFSEFLDEETEAAVSDRIEAHRDSCDRCRLYASTLETGRELLRSMPPMEVPADFHSRLNHRIFHLEDGASIAKESSGSGATMASVLTMAVLIALSAWAPTVGRGAPSVELPALVVAEPSAPSFTRDQTSPTFPRNLSLFTTTEFQDGIWGDSHDLLREYSPILDRRRGQPLVRVGIE